MHSERRGKGRGIRLPSRVSAEPQPIMKAISVRFVSDKLPLGTKILLNVAKCGVTELLK